MISCWTIQSLDRETRALSSTSSIPLSFFLSSTKNRTHSRLINSIRDLAFDDELSIIAHLSLPACIGWLALSSLVRCSVVQLSCNAMVTSSLTSTIPIYSLQTFHLGKLSSSSRPHLMFLLKKKSSFSFSVFLLLCKKIFFVSQYFPPFPSLFFFSSEKNVSFSKYWPEMSAVVR